LAISSVSRRLVGRLDFDAIRARRVANFERLAERLRGRVTPVFAALPTGVCPLFYPILVQHKHETALGLRARRIEALEFWNDAVELAGCERSGAERTLRAHVLELPIHQDLHTTHVDYLAQQVSSLDLRMRDAADSVCAA